MSGHLSAEGLYVDDLPSDAGDDAPLVVLVHGAMDRHTGFGRVRGVLMETCHVVSYDRRGYAGSRHAEPAAAHLADHVEDLERVVAGRACTLAGHSYGGDIALAFAERRPELVRSALVYEPPLAWLEWWPHHGTQPPQYRGLEGHEAAEAFLRNMIGNRRYEHLPPAVLEDVLQDGDALVRELTAIRLDPPPFDPRNIAVPVLVAYGEDTEERHRRGAAELAAELPAGSLHTIAGARHGAQQSHPFEFARLVLAAVALADEPTAARPPALS